MNRMARPNATMRVTIMCTPEEYALFRASATTDHRHIAHQVAFLALEALETRRLETELRDKLERRAGNAPDHSTPRPDK
jgi:hypothetical protein